MAEYSDNRERLKTNSDPLSETKINTAILKVKVEQNKILYLPQLIFDSITTM